MLWVHLLDKIKQNENGWTGERNYKEVYILNLSPIVAKHNESRISRFTQNNFETALNLLKSTLNKNDMTWFMRPEPLKPVTFLNVQ